MSLGQLRGLTGKGIQAAVFNDLVAGPGLGIKGFLVLFFKKGTSFSGPPGPFMIICG